MDTLLRYLLLSGIVIFVYMILRHPLQLRQIGRKARLVALIYVGVIVVSGLLRLACLNGLLVDGICGAFGT